MLDKHNKHRVHESWSWVLSPESSVLGLSQGFYDGDDHPRHHPQDLPKHPHPPPTAHHDAFNMASVAVSLSVSLSLRWAGDSPGSVCVRYKRSLPNK